MAHWGIAMSVFHQIWDRPDEHAVDLGTREMRLARLHPAKDRSGTRIYRRTQRLFPARQGRISGAHRTLHRRHGETL